MAERPNVLMVLSDQHNPQITGFEGDGQVKTPHMDRLAAEGIWFRHAYAQNPICTPSRVSILSGQYCHNHGYYGLGGPTPDNLPNLFGHFRRNGYRTAGIGKLHVPDDPVDWASEDCDLWLDFQRGEAYFDYLTELGLREKEDSMFLPEFADRKYVKWVDARPSSLPFEHSPEGWAVTEAVGFMKGCGEQPFFMQVSFPRPHHALTPAKEFWEMYPEDVELPETFYQEADGRPPHFRKMREEFLSMEWPLEPTDTESGIRRVWRGYLACITHCDHALGMLLDYLDRSGKAENTIVIYGSDHGGYMGTFGVREKAPGICSEAVCRVPFVWRVPGVATEGAGNGQLVELVDMAATLPGLCGLEEMERVDGRDISGLLRGGSDPVREMAVTENAWSRAMRWGRWRFVHYPRDLFAGEDVGELYDLENDPTEKVNLYGDPAHAELVHECRRRLLEWLIRTSTVRNVHPRLREADVAERASKMNDAGVALRAELANPEDRCQYRNYL